MEDLGKYLQEQREAHNISIDEMAFRTKIPIRFIKAIEDNQFDQLPSQVSTKGFLRSYAQCLGLDDADVLEAFSNHVSSPKESLTSPEDEDDILAFLQVKRPSRLPFPRRVLLMVGGVIVLLLILVGLLPERNEGVRPLPPPLLSNEEMFAPETSLPGETSFDEVAEPAEESPSAIDENGQEGQTVIDEKEDTLSSEQPPSDKVKVEVEPAPGDLSPSEMPSSTEEKPFPVSEVNLDLYVLSIEASEPSWVQVKIDDGEVREVLLQANDTVSWTAKEKFLVKLGNAGGVRVMLNGHDLGPFGPIGEVVEKEVIGALAISD